MGYTKSPTRIIIHGIKSPNEQIRKKIQAKLERTNIGKTVLVTFQKKNK